MKRDVPNWLLLSLLVLGVWQLGRLLGWAIFIVAHRFAEVYL